VAGRHEYDVAPDSGFYPDAEQLLGIGLSNESTGIYAGIRRSCQRAMA